MIIGKLLPMLLFLVMIFVLAQSVHSQDTTNTSSLISSRSTTFVKQKISKLTPMLIKQEITKNKVLKQPEVILSGLKIQSSVRQATDSIEILNGFVTTSELLDAAPLDGNPYFILAILCSHGVIAGAGCFGNQGFNRVTVNTYADGRKEFFWDGTFMNGQNLDDYYPPGTDKRIRNLLRNSLNVYYVRKNGIIDLKPIKPYLSQDKLVLTKDPIDISSGEMYINVTDFSIPSRGTSFNIPRSYRSNENINGFFGFGWRSALDKNLLDEGYQNILVYDASGNSSLYSKNLLDGSFSLSQRDHSSISKNQDGTCVVKDKYGFLTSYSLEGRMTQKVDRNGNVLKFVYVVKAGPVGDG